ncbi:phosphoesterase [Cutibacterium sp. WCA-380-WT-3A]|uniref:Phosphoesterase n=1 Tax=Cutibacterium porci TaxID=2605781 RepID=A0A7K0J7R6_9ACTN|nr:alkaline phosphatase family protein [Cutibacterium porci]MSS46002.1 phosphoesterase [Cutibacterium porci]
MHISHPRLTRLVSASVAAGMAAFGFAAPIASHAQPNSKPTPGTSQTAQKHTTISSVASGKIKHVWLIILENKSYDATFSGLNQNSYLWKELPQQGALLPHYFGTGHYSQDNYTSMVSGQSAEMDLQSDCDVANTNFGSNSSIIDRHSGTQFGRDDNYGQVLSLAGPNAQDGKNGCTYPKDVPTLFNQLDAAGVTWKGYAQDLRNHPGREDGLAGSPGTLDNTPDNNPKAMKPTEQDKAKGITSFTGAQPDDQYVAKHFPFPWFHSIIGNDGTGKDSLTTPADGGTPSDSKHIANADDPSHGLLADLAKPANQVPAFNWITPNNCSDAHDATCKGNNLSGLFDADGKPDYSKPLTTPPKNHTGGLYAADLWLRYYIPLIEKSAAFKDGGLIDITFDEANPPFADMSFNNATDDSDVSNDARKDELYTYSPQTIKDLDEGYKKYAANTFPKPSKMSKNYINADLAGQNINGQNVDWEPTGPNSTLDTDEHGNQLFPGPGNNSFITRPPSCEQDTDLVNADKSNCVHGAKNTGAEWGYSKAKTIDVTNTAGTSTLTGKVTVTDLGRKVTGDGIPQGAYVGKVANHGPNMVADPKDSATNSSFVIVDANDKPLNTTADVTSVTLSATGVPGHLASDQSPLATFNAHDATPGGGATGSVLISPYIKPGTVSNTYYNHFSWLRTMEDLFEVSKGKDTRQLEAGTVSTGLDGQGHLGFAAQAGLGTFGTDVLNNLPADSAPSTAPSTPASSAPSATPPATTPTPHKTPSSSATAPATTTTSSAPGHGGSHPNLPRTGSDGVSDPAATESGAAGLILVGGAVATWAIRRNRC